MCSLCCNLLHIFKRKQAQKSLFSRCERRLAERIAAAGQKNQDPDDAFAPTPGVISAEEAAAAPTAVTAASVVAAAEQDKDPYNGIAPEPTTIICVASAICCC